MRYQFDGKFHRNDRHTLVQRREMCLLINAGVPYRIIENAYDVNPNTLRVISGQRSQMLPAEQIARTPEQKFAYAQRLYAETQTDIIRKTIDDAILKPFTRSVAARMLQPEPREILLEEILGENPRMSKEHAEQVYSLVHLLAIRGILAQKPYRDEENARWELAPPVRTHFATHETPELRAWRIMRDTQLDRTLDALTATEKNVICQQYGINQAPRSLVDIAKSYGDRPKQWAHKIKRDALNRIQSEARAFYQTLCLV